MADIQTNPYLFFQGNCREAMEFYKSIFGGELDIKTNADFNMTGDDRPADGVMHAQLSGGDVLLMASDSPLASPVAKKVTISLSGTDEARLRAIFDRLSEDVEVQYPLKKEVWGDVFGAVVDKYGVDWMVNISPSA